MKRKLSRKSKKVNKKSKPKRNMAKKRKSMSRGKRSIGSKIPLVNNPSFKKAAAGVGTATIGVTLLSFVAPSIAGQPLIRPALAYFGGGVEGVIAQLLSSGQGLNLFGGSTSNGGGGAA